MSRWGVAATAQQEADMAKKMTHVQSSNGASGWETRPKPLTPFETPSRRVGSAKGTL